MQGLAMMVPQARTTPIPVQCHCIVKLGGSAITFKNKLETLRTETLQQVCKCIQQLHSISPGGIVLVHGAGSFGHFQASQYNVAKGGHDAAAAVQGFVETRRSVTQLNHVVVSALLDAGVPAVGLSPCGTWQCDNRQLPDATAGIAAVTAVLQHGMVPVLHGDCVFDSSLGVTILSGDSIIRRLAAGLHPKYCVFLTDVPGLLTKHPDQPDAQLIPIVEVAQDGSWTAAVPTTVHSHSGTGSSAACHHTADSTAVASSSSSNIELSAAAHDTTGGIAAKVAEAAAVVLETGCAVVIAQAGTTSGAAAVLQGPVAFAGSGGSSSSSSMRYQRSHEDECGAAWGSSRSAGLGDADKQQQQQQQHNGVLQATIIRPAV